MGLLFSFLILVLNLVVLGVVYWAVCEVITKVIPARFLPGETKATLLSIAKIIFVVVAAIWVITWLIGLLGGGAMSYVPMFYHRPIK